jgi:hypothetical protein
MPGHWVLARLGKRVLRPGGIELTRQILSNLDIQPNDDVVEFAPGLGVTARITLRSRPASYTAIERDECAASKVRRYLAGSSQKCIVGTAEETGLRSCCASVVYGEAMLTMQTKEQKRRIVKEAARLLKPSGRYAMHEICLIPDDIGDDVIAGVQKELAQVIRVGARPLRTAEWRALVESQGLRVTEEYTRPFALLEPSRLIRDEGVIGALRFGFNVLRLKDARRRVIKMRQTFRRLLPHLQAYALVAQKG